MIPSFVEAQNGGEFNTAHIIKSGFVWRWKMPLQGVQGFKGLKLPKLNGFRLGSLHGCKSRLAPKIHDLSDLSIFIMLMFHHFPICSLYWDRAIAQTTHTTTATGPTGPTGLTVPNHMIQNLRSLAARAAAGLWGWKGPSGGNHG